MTDIKSAIETLENALKGAFIVPSECALVGTDIISICLETLKDREQILLDAENDAYSRGVLAGIELSKNENSNACGKVLAELKSAKVNNIPCDSAEEAIGIRKGLTYAIDIINQKITDLIEEQAKQHK